MIAQVHTRAIRPPARKSARQVGMDLSVPWRMDHRRVHTQVEYDGGERSKDG